MFMGDYFIEMEYNDTSMRDWRNKSIEKYVRKHFKFK